MLAIPLELEGMWDTVSVDNYSQTTIPRRYAVGDAMGSGAGNSTSYDHWCFSAQHIVQ